MAQVPTKNAKESTNILGRNQDDKSNEGGQ